MDFNSPTFLLFIFTVAILLIAATYNRFNPELFSRMRIGRNIALYLYGEDYQLIENIKIRTANGQNLFIKQLVVSRYGLFLIETCHYRSTIYGSNHQVKWLSEGKRHSTVFINPSMAHKPSCVILAEYLQIPLKVIEVISVFTGNSKLPIPLPKNSCKTDSLIKSIAEHKTVRINPSLLPDIILLLQSDRRSLDPQINKS